LRRVYNKKQIKLNKFKMKILALDVGKKRIGLATSESNIIASEYGVVVSASDMEKLEKIVKIIEDEKIEKIIIGLPCLASGEESTQAQHVRNFAINLGSLINSDIEIIFEDEILSSWQAEKELNSEGASLKEIKSRVDAVSAKIILEQFLNRL